MNLSDVIHATSQPYSALQRKIDFHNWLFFSRSLAFNMQAQTQSNWCWAATARSVSHYYWFLSRWSQCNIACAELSLTTCCDAPVPDACNVSWWMDKASLRHIWQQRSLLGVKAGQPVEQLEDTKGRSLGLAHPVFTLGLEALREGDPRAAQTGVRVIEFERETPRAFYDLAHDEKKVRQMSASGAYLQLLPRALEVVAALPAGERQFELRLLRAPALNFEALWLHSGDGAEDRVIPLRGFHGFTAVQPVSYREASEKLRHAARLLNQQESGMGA